MKVLVCGGRGYWKKEKVEGVLDLLHRTIGITGIVAGGATGADELGVAWAFKRGVPWKERPARWNLYHLAAGGIRNQEMLDLDEPNLVVAFPGKRGTADMVHRARWNGVTVLEIG